jgi:hypothetical protein
MKAVRVLEYGGQLVVDEVPTPTIARDEILVKIKNTAVNHVDLVKHERQSVGSSTGVCDREICFAVFFRAQFFPGTSHGRQSPSILLGTA